jgi:Uma2 family endonuclease
MSAVMQLRYTYEQYLAREEAAEYRSEFYRGEIFAMSGGTPQHSKISINLSSSMRGILRRKGCRPYGSDQRIRVPKNGLATYPDVSIVCGDLQLHAEDPNAIINPKVIFEVLSQSTESYDRGKKFDLYRDLESLKEYVLVSQTEPLVERFIRQPDNSWNLTIFKGLEATLDLPSLGCSLPLAEIYEDVTFGPEEGSPEIGVQG